MRGGCGLGDMTLYDGPQEIHAVGKLVDLLQDEFYSV